MIHEPMDKDIIYYSHVNEDSRVERELLSKSSCKTVVAVCGSGERVLSLMDTIHCLHLKVVDINPRAIFLLQLKIVALTHFSVEDYLQFIGHVYLQPNERLKLYKTLRKNLTSEATAFWDNHLQYIRDGILFAGYFEKFLSRIRPLVAIFLGSNFFNVLSGDRTSNFPLMKWKILLKLFSYRWVYQIAGNNDVAFTGKGAKLCQVSRALEQSIEDGKISSSFIAHLIFKGNLMHMRPSEMPPSLQPQVLSIIKSRLIEGEMKIEYFSQDFLQFIKKETAKNKVAAFYSISDILSYTDFYYLKEIIQQLKSSDILVGRGFVRNRLPDQALAEIAKHGMVDIHDDQDSTLMYQVFSFKPVY